MKRLKKFFLEIKENWQEVLGITIAFIGIIFISPGVWLGLLARAAIVVGSILVWKYGMPKRRDDDPKNW